MWRLKTANNAPNAYQQQSSNDSVHEALDLQLVRALFEQEGRYFFKFEIRSDQSSLLSLTGRTDVSVQLDRNPLFRKTRFTWPLPANVSFDVVITANIVSREAVRGATSVQTIGECVLPISKSSISQMRSQTLKHVVSFGQSIGQVELLTTVIPWDPSLKPPTPISNGPNILNATSSDSIASQPMLRERLDKIPVPPISPSNDVTSYSPGEELYQGLIANASVYFPFSNGQIVKVLVHRVLDLPARSVPSAVDDLAIIYPEAFVSLKTDEDARQRIAAKAATHVARSSRNPHFNETLVISLPGVNSRDFSEPVRSANLPSLFLTVADQSSKRIITRFVLPMYWIHPYRQLNLILESPLTQGNDSMSTPESRTKLRISVMMMDTAISSLRQLNENYEGKIVFETFLQGLTMSKTQVGLPDPIWSKVPIIATGRWVASKAAYLETIKNYTQRLQNGLNVPYPESPKSIHVSYEHEGRPPSTWGPALLDSYMPTASHRLFFQTTAESIHENEHRLPVWYQLWTWILNKEDLVSLDGALIVEYYRSPNAQNLIEYTNETVDANELLGYSIMELSDVSWNRRAFSVDAGTALNAIGSQRVLLQVPVVPCGSYFVNYGVRDAAQLEARIDVHVTNQFWTCFGISNNTNRHPLPSKVEMILNSDTVKSPALVLSEDDKPSLMKELEMRGQTLRRLGAELVKQRNEYNQLELKYCILKDQLNEQKESINHLTILDGIDQVPQMELQEKYTSLRQRYKLECAKNKEMSSKLSEMHDVVMQKNLLEQQLIELRKAHVEQQNLLQMLQSKVDESLNQAGLVQKQSNVIKQLEGLLRSYILLDRSSTQNRDLSRIQILEETMHQMQEFPIKAIKKKNIDGTLSRALAQGVKQLSDSLASDKNNSDVNLDNTSATTSKLAH